ncbi:MAG: thiamine phosphate synthase [Rhodovibrionaceae bacterium]
MSGKPAFDLRLYLVLGSQDTAPGRLEDTLRAALAGGVTLLQLREKNAGSEQTVALGKRIKAILDPLGVPLIVNDDIEAARALGAAGVHLGQDDLPAAEARKLLGPDSIVGVSTGTPEEARRIDMSQVDYLGIGPVFATSTKADAGDAIGAEGIRAVLETAPLRSVAIGGITAENAASCIAAGAEGVAVVSAICGAADPEAAARRLRAAVAGARD